MNFSLLYKFLFALTIFLINPWGESLVNTGRAEIWTHPKVLVVATITAINLFQIIAQNCEIRSDAPRLSSYKVFVILWAGYITTATIATILSPFPIHSLFGEPVLGDGLLYWLLIGVFSCSNVVLLRIRPELFNAQLHGFLIGGSILALSIFPQLIDWSVDYTATSGQISNYDNRLLKSGIWQMQMPVGLYSNRGYAAFVLASISGLGIISTTKHWIAFRLGIASVCLTSLALIATQARAGILALLIGIGCWFANNHYQMILRLRQQLQHIWIIWLCGFVGAIFAACIIASVPDAILIWRQATPETLQDGSTGRFYLWSLAIDGFLVRPWIGWGFNGFGIAHLFVGDWGEQLSSYIPEGSSVTQILEISESMFAFVSNDGETYTGSVLTHKAHNLSLDVLLSTGILGLAAYGALISFSYWHLAKSQLSSVGIVAVIYLIFTQFWFESAQYSHLFWWVLSLGLATKLEEDS